jgi:hypothetical protein
MSGRSAIRSRIDHVTKAAAAVVEYADKRRS